MEEQDSPCQVCHTNDHPPIRKCDDPNCEVHLCDGCVLQCKECHVPLCVDHLADCVVCGDCVFCEPCLEEHLKPGGNCPGPFHNAE